MTEAENNLNDLAHIRQLMERSSKFVSLSGLSGVFVGIYALVGAALVFYFDNNVISNIQNSQLETPTLFGLNFTQFCILDAVIVLSVSLLTCFYLSYAKAKKMGEKIWNNLSKRVFINMMVPLSSGGLFCMALIYHHIFIMVAPAMLIFYGMALVNVSKYTYHDIFNLGIIEIILGLLASLFIMNGLLFWSLGFGLMHIVYGILMYYKYERKIN